MTAEQKPAPRPRGLVGTAPVLGDACVPGCDDPAIDWDGVHYCCVEVARVELLSQREWPSMAQAIAVEVRQSQGRDGSLERTVWLISIAGDGRYADDGAQFDATVTTPLAAAMARAVELAAGAPAKARRHRGLSRLEYWRRHGRRRPW